MSGFPPPHTQHLSHIYDTLTFMFECQGWGGGGGVISHSIGNQHQETIAATEANNGTYCLKSMMIKALIYCVSTASFFLLDLVGSCRSLLDAGCNSLCIQLYSHLINFCHLFLVSSVAASVAGVKLHFMLLPVFIKSSFKDIYCL